MDSRADASTDAVTEMIPLLIVARICIDRSELGLVLKTAGVENLGISIAVGVIMYPPNVEDKR